MAKKWYVVHVYSGFEKKIAQQIKEQAAQKGLAEQFDEVLVPSEQVVELRQLGVRQVACGSGQQALNALRRGTKRQQPLDGQQVG